MEVGRDFVRVQRVRVFVLVTLCFGLVCSCVCVVFEKRGKEERGRLTTESKKERKRQSTEIRRRRRVG